MKLWCSGYMEYDIEKANLNQKVEQLTQGLAVARRCARLWKNEAKYRYKQYKLLMVQVAKLLGLK